MTKCMAYEVEVVRPGGRTKKIWIKIMDMSDLTSDN